MRYWVKKYFSSQILKKKERNIIWKLLHFKSPNYDSAPVHLFTCSPETVWLCPLVVVQLKLYWDQYQDSEAAETGSADWTEKEKKKFYKFLNFSPFLQKKKRNAQKKISLDAKVKKIFKNLKYLKTVHFQPIRTQPVYQPVSQSASSSSAQSHDAMDVFKNWMCPWKNLLQPKTHFPNRAAFWNPADRNLCTSTCSLLCCLFLSHGGSIVVKLFQRKVFFSLNDVTAVCEHDATRSLKLTLYYSENSR